MCTPIKETLASLFPSSSGVSVIAEPGRYFVESAMTLAACVIGKKRHQEPKGNFSQAVL